MLSWFHILVILAICAIVFIFVKLRYLRHKFTWIILLIFILLFYIGFVISTSGKGINFSSVDGMKTAIKLYLSWLVHGFGNLKVLTSHAIKLDWSSSNNTEQG